MGNQALSFLFKIDVIEAKDGLSPQYFADGSYKPPIEKDHYSQLESTGWFRWTTNGVFPVGNSPELGRRRYSTSLFYDGCSTDAFLFHPADCQTINILDVERSDTEAWGWQKLWFTEKDENHSLLDLYGEYDTLCGRSTSYVPHFLPQKYQSSDNTATCGLSGDMGLLLALAAFSCRQEHMMDAITWRLNLRERKWENVSIHEWGNGRIHGRGLVIHIVEDGVCTDLLAWEHGDHGPLLQ